MRTVAGCRESPDQKPRGPSFPDRKQYALRAYPLHRRILSPSKIADSIGCSMMPSPAPARASVEAPVWPAPRLAGRQVGVVLEGAAWAFQADRIAPRPAADSTACTRLEGLRDGLSKRPGTGGLELPGPALGEAAAGGPPRYGGEGPGPRRLRNRFMVPGIL